MGYVERAQPASRTRIRSERPARRRPVRVLHLLRDPREVRRKVCSMSVNETSTEDEAEGRAAARDERPGQLTQVTRAMVAIYKDQFGRGPDARAQPLRRART